MLSIRMTRRVERLEQRAHWAHGQPERTFLVLMGYAWKKAILANATYERLPGAPGVPVELVQLDGHADGLAEGELDAWLVEQRRHYHATHTPGRRP